METTFDTQEYFDKMNAWWRAANYLSVGQIYLKDNPLLRRPIEEKDLSIRLVTGAPLLVRILSTPT